MLKFYNYYINIYYKDEEVEHSYITRLILEESEASKKIEELTWENISEKYHKHGYRYPFALRDTKKGKRIDFSWKNITIKEWKEKELNIRVEYEYKEDTYFSINDILKYSNIDKAIQFLKERGMSIK